MAANNTSIVYDGADHFVLHQTYAFLYNQQYKLAIENSALLLLIC